MNEHWITCSKTAAAIESVSRAYFLDKHEIWLDRLNLHETCWMIFAGKEEHLTEPFGWPGIN